MSIFDHVASTCSAEASRLAKSHKQSWGYMLCDVHAGSQVLALTASGELEFQEVFMFTHQSHQVAAHVTVHTKSGNRLTLTPDHYLPTRQSCSKFPIAKLVAAGKLAIGDEIQIANMTSIGWSAVVAIASGMAPGLFNPHTVAGTIIVDGIVASCFPNTLPPHTMYHSIVTAPFRLLYTVIPLPLAVWLNEALLSAYFHAEPLLAAAAGFQSLA